MADVFAKNGVDCSEVSFCKGPARYFPDRRKLFGMTCAPQRNSNAWLVQEPADRQMNQALAKVFARECIQFVCCIDVLEKMGRLKLRVSVLAQCRQRQTDDRRALYRLAIRGKGRRKSAW